MLKLAEGGIIAGQINDCERTAPDVMPSLPGLMGLKQQIPKGIEGTDHSVILLGENAFRPGPALYLNIYPENPPEGPLRLSGGRRGIRTHRYTFVIERLRGKTQTYILRDNKLDPYQIEDIADKNPELVKELAAELNQWLEKTDDPWLKTNHRSLITLSGTHCPVYRTLQVPPDALQEAPVLLLLPTDAQNVDISLSVS